MTSSAQQGKINNSRGKTCVQIKYYMYVQTVTVAHLSSWIRQRLYLRGMEWCTKELQYISARKALSLSVWVLLSAISLPLQQTINAYGECAHSFSERESFSGDEFTFTIKDGFDASWETCFFHVKLLTNSKLHGVKEKHHISIGFCGSLIQNIKCLDDGIPL